MSDSTTRISDLPSNIKFELNDESQGNQAYKPMNVHPNPYGNSNNPDVMPHPESVQVPQPQQTIPSRDIPIDTTSYQQDETIKPNYIPPSNVQDDYIREYETDTMRICVNTKSTKKMKNPWIVFYRNFKCLFSWGYYISFFKCRSWMDFLNVRSRFFPSKKVMVI